MPNPEHLHILTRGVEVWNEWKRGLRAEIPYSEGIGEIYSLPAHERYKALEGRTNNSRFIYADLTDANLCALNLEGIDFSYTNLSGANLSSSSLTYADFTRSVLSETNFTNANLQGANFDSSSLSQAQFGDNDLSQVLGLENVFLAEPSIIGVNTVYRSGGNIPDKFLRNCEVPEELIRWMQFRIFTPETKGKIAKGKIPKTFRELLKSKAPTWSTDPFESFFRYLTELTDITHLSVTAISILRAIPIAQIHFGPNADQTYQGLIEQAKQEEESGFPLLYIHETVSLWSALESLIKEILVCWLINEPSAMQVEAISKVKISLGEYEQLNVEERCHYILDLLERDLKAPFKHGVERFESMLGVFGLSGDLDPELRRTLFELSNIRNVLVHRRGVADRRLIQACPWLQLDIGEALHIGEQEFLRYVTAVGGYVEKVHDRVESRFVGFAPD